MTTISQYLFNVALPNHNLPEASSMEDTRNLCEIWGVDPDELITDDLEKDIDCYLESCAQVVNEQRAWDPYVTDPFTGQRKLTNNEASDLLRPCTKKENNVCGICFDDEGAVSETLCGHTFHKKCIVQWVQTSKATCPSCNRDFLADLRSPPNRGRRIKIPRRS